MASAISARMAEPDAYGVGITNALGPLFVTDPSHHQLEVRHRSVRGIREHHRQRYAVVSCLDGLDLHDIPPNQFLCGQLCRIRISNLDRAHAIPYIKGYNPEDEDGSMPQESAA